MGGGTLNKLITGNLAHLVGVAIYGIIGIVLAIICYKIFIKLIPLNTGLDASPQESLAASILAVGIIIGMSIIVAVTGYDPNPIKFPKVLKLKNIVAGAARSSDSSCGTSCGTPKNKSDAKKKTPKTDIDKTTN